MTESELLQNHSSLVYNLALRLTGNSSDAEDLAQDALLRALKALPNFRGDSAPSTWLYRITVNTWKNRVRSEKRRGFWRTIPLGFLIAGSDDDEGERDIKAEEAPLDSGLGIREAGAAVQKALMSLDEESRAVVVLRDIQGLAYQEIAAALDIPEGTVKSRLSRSREVLKGLLKSFVQAG